MNQLKILSNIIDVFIPKNETKLNRVRVAMVTLSLVSPSRELNVKILFNFTSYRSKSALKTAMETIVIQKQESFHYDEAVKALREWFEARGHGVRADALHLVIMAASNLKIPESPATATLDQSSFKPNPINIRLFLLILDHEFSITIKDFAPDNSYMSITELQDFDAVKNNLSVKMCKQCYEGYTIEDQSRANEGQVSCYKLVPHNATLNWMDARVACESEFSDLVSIETRRELSFLKNSLKQILHDQIFASQESVGVYIGLRREDTTLGRRFRWVNKMPLAYTHWQTNEPRSGTAAGCVIWFFISSASDNTSYLSNGSVTDFWASTGCGRAGGYFYLCESSYSFITPKSTTSQSSFVERLPMPSKESIDGAIQRGELARKADGTLVSLTTLRTTSTEVTIVDRDQKRTTNFSEIPAYKCDLQGNNKIFYTSVCNFERDCWNGVDEYFCNNAECNPEKQFRCKSGLCIPKELVCDLYNDCRDGDDEIDCIRCPHARCQDGRCLPKHWFADGEIDCDSCSLQKENNMTYILSDADTEMQSANDDKINQCVFTCNRSECVYIHMLNDSNVDCFGPEGPIDENIGAFESTTCYDDETEAIKYTNWAPKCIYIKDRFNEPIGCRNMKHLENCEDFECPESFVKCLNSHYCVPSYYVNNNKFDCAQGEDENVAIECPGYFTCAKEDDKNKNICIHPDLVCDGNINCPQADDELNCHVTCEPGFKCIANTVVGDFDKPHVLLNISFVDARTRYIDFTGINISSVFPRIPKGILANVVTAKLSNCSIANISKELRNSHWEDFRSVRELDLSLNHIERVTFLNIFRYMPRLKFLNLSRNEQLTYIHPDALNAFQRSQSQLEVLDLSYTGLQDINWQMFRLLNALKSLYLRNTQIATLAPGMFPANFRLNSLDLRGNTISRIYPEMFVNVTVKTNLYFDNFKLCCPQLHNEETYLKGCQFPKDPFSSCSDLISSNCLQVLLFVSGFLALIGNGVVIVYRIVFDKAIFKMGYGQFVTHLSFSDFLMGVYLIIIASADVNYRGSYLWDEIQWRNSVLCKLAGFLSTLSCEVSTLFVFLITFDRFLVIRFPFGQFKLRGKTVVGLCIVAWTVGIVLAIIPALSYFGGWSVYTATGTCVGLPLISDSNPGWLYAQSIFIYVNFVLFIVIAIGQVVIYKAMSDMTINMTCLNGSSTRRAQDMTVAKRLSLVVVTNFLCWFPIGVLGLVVLSGYDIGIEAYSWLVVTVLPVNSAINPILYTVPGLIMKWRRFKESPTHLKSLTK